MPKKYRFDPLNILSKTSNKSSTFKEALLSKPSSDLEKIIFPWDYYVGGYSISEFNARQKT